MKRKRLLFVFNPNAGMGRLKTRLGGIFETFSDSEYEIIAHATLGRDDAYNTAQKYASHGIDRIVCAGGDGTLNEVVRGVLSSKPKNENAQGPNTPIGYIPCGTTNDFGYTLGLSNNAAEAAKTAVGKHLLRCDSARLNGREFVYTASFGLFTETSYSTPQSMKNAFGRLAYLVNGANSIPKARAYNMKFLCDDGEKKFVIKGKFFVGMVANSNSVGGFRSLLGKDVRLDDGLFELILLRHPESITDLVSEARDVIGHKYRDNRVIYRKVKSVTVISDEEISWSIDGEFGGKQNRTKIDVCPKSVTYVTGERAQSMAGSSGKNTAAKGFGEVILKAVQIIMKADRP